MFSQTRNRATLNATLSISILPLDVGLAFGRAVRACLRILSDLLLGTSRDAF